jgi:hypothetical protein
MTGYLLTWNPKRWTWSQEDIARERANVGKARVEPTNWSCGNRRTLPVGSRVFLARQGTSVRGIVGLGHTVEEPQEGAHFDSDRARRGDTAMYVAFRFDALVDPYGDGLLAITSLPKRLRSGIKWGTQVSGIAIEDSLATELEAECERHFGERLVSAPSQVADVQRSLTLSRRLARNSAFSKLVRGKSGGQCAACVMNVDYEALGVLEAAHVKSVASNGTDSLGNALALCPTHHSLFDALLWSFDTTGAEIRFSPRMPASLRLSFSSKVQSSWGLHAASVKWHREQANVNKQWTGKPPAVRQLGRGR